MNNSQFRNLVGNQKDETSQNGLSKSTLGSRSRPAIPMTPRALGGRKQSNDLAHQIAEHKRESNGEPPTKKFKSSAAPKGTKLASGYTDRSSERRGQDDEQEEDIAKRLKALEEMLKLQQIDQATFDKLRDEIGVGGDTSSTHLVKGLDWKLLDRVRRGENINKAAVKDPSGPEEEPNVDDELEKALEKEIDSQAKKSQIEEETGREAEVSSQPTTRDEILRRLKESRLGPAAAIPEPAPALSEKFKKFGGGDTSKPGKKKFTESVNGRRREVLIITDKEGNTKRKTRWIDPESATPSMQQQETWGGDVSEEITAQQKAYEEEQKRKAAEEEEEADGDIFADAGEYNPLAGLRSDESEDEDEEAESQPKTSSHEGNASLTTASNQQATQRRDYFATGDTKASGENTEPDEPRITQDPTILAALKRAAQLRQHDSSNADGSSSTNPEQESQRRAFLAKLKEQERQDAQDFDMGFGDSRYGDEDEEEHGGALATWGDDGDGEQKRGAGSSGRKRGPKKRKGNKDNVQDVMSVLQGRQKGA